MNFFSLLRFSGSLLAALALFPATAVPQTSRGQSSLNALRAACSDDAARLCSGVSSGGGRVVACLKQHQDQLSDACRKAGGLPPRSGAAQPDNLQSGSLSADESVSSSSASASSLPPTSGLGNAIMDAATAPAHGTTPPAIGQTTHVAGENFIRRPIVDPAHDNMTVATVHIPEKWSLDNKVEWHYNWIESPLIVSARAANPANSEAYELYPVLRFDAVEIAPQYRQYMRGSQTPSGQRSPTGAISMALQQPIPAMITFIKQARPSVDIKWVGSQELPTYAQSLGLSPWAGDHGIAIKISYDLNGQKVDEAFFGDYYVSQGGNSAVSVGQQNGSANGVRQTNWGFRALMSFRAPTGTLERRMPVFALIAKSYFINPQWAQLYKSIGDKLLADFNGKLKQGYDQIRASQAAMSQAMAQEKAFDAQVDKFDANLRKPFDDSWLRTTGGGNGSAPGQLSAVDRASNLYRDQATVADSDSSTGTTQVSNAGDYHFTNGLGDYRTYSDPNMTPEKAGEGGNWKQLNEIP